MPTEDISDALEDLDASADDVYRANFRIASDAIHRFLGLLDGAPLKTVLLSAVPPYDFPALLKDALATGGSMVGSKRFRWPIAAPERVSAQLQLVRALDNNELNITTLLLDFYYVDKNLTRNYQEFVSQFFQPFYRDLRRLLSKHNDPPQIAATVQSQTMIAADPRKVFVVHGRNDRARVAMFAFLRSLGLQPIEWTEAVHMAPGATPYVGQILENAFASARAVIVLLTGDDLAVLHEQFRSSHDDPYESTLTPQARPNVLFEAGLAFGVHPDRTILVELGRLRPFSDIGGRHVLRIGNSTAYRQDLAMRLEKAGCAVELSGTDWHTTGDFDGAVAVQAVAQPSDSQRSDENNLDSMYVEILLCLSRLPVGQTVPLEQVAAEINVPPQKAMHYVEWLVDNNFAYDVLIMGSGARYGLDRRGRAYLIDRKML